MTTTATTEDLLLDEVAEQLRVSRKTAMRMAAKGCFANAYKVRAGAPHGTWRVPQADIDAIKRGARAEPAAAVA